MRSYVPEQEVISHKLTLGRQSVVGSVSADQVEGPVHPQKMEAFIRGDQSGTVLNRGIVSWAHALGMLFSTRAP